MSEENSHESPFLLIENDQVFYLEKEETNIGRGNHNDLIILDVQVSRTHAKIKEVNQRFLLMDLGSSGGTYVNDTRVEQKILLPDDTILLSGSYKMVFMQDRSNLPPDTKLYSVGISQEKSSLSTTSIKIPTVSFPEDED
ncbi:MAG: FHA domain-containing protein [Chloroflexi bacterium]|nr:FHA domain-containing protein [Chloroflexota bacterium]